MTMTGKVVSVNISVEKGTVKLPVEEIFVDDRGIVDDAHAGNWHRQVSLLAKEDIDKFSSEMERQISFGEFAENITTEGLDLSKVCALDSIRIGDVTLEVTQIGKKCHGDGCAIFREVGQCAMPKQGIFSRVISGGKIAAGDTITVEPRAFRVMVITLSDRAYSGEYSDRSGPKVCKLLDEYFSDTRWHLEVDANILPDDVPMLSKELDGAADDGVDVVFTVGGTGIGPRDITSDVVERFCEKLIPGIMENIRIKYGQEKPSALLSRSVAGITGRTQIYAIPGSVRAVEEYVAEILKTLEHTVYMLHGLDVH